MRYSLFYLILAVLNFSICFSEIPQSISWQGILQDVNGNNLNGQFNITCKLYDVASGGNALWTESHTNLTIENGLTNLSLGTISSLNLLFNVQYWLEITIGNGTPLPRIKLSSVPYSLYSAKSSGVIQNDSLVLKDAQGVTRMVMNPNTGTFKMMNNDTVWYSLSVQSPVSEKMTFINGMTLEKAPITDGYETTVKDADGNLMYKEKEIQQRSDDQNRYYNIKEDYIKDPQTNTYYKYREVIEDNIGETDVNDVKITNLKTEITYNKDGFTTSKKETEFSSHPRAGDSETDYQESVTTYNFDNNGNQLGYIFESKYYGFPHPTVITKETYQGDKIKQRETSSEDPFLMKEKYNKIEYFDDNGNFLYEYFERIDLNTGKKIVEIRNANQGTSLKQSTQKLTFSNKGSSIELDIQQDPYLNNIDISAYLNNTTQKRIARVNSDGSVLLGQSGNIEINQSGTNFTGNVNSAGTTQFQGNTFHNGTNYFSGGIFANTAQFNGDVLIGSSNPPKYLTVSGGVNVGGISNFNDNLNIGGNVSIGGSLSVVGTMDFGNANLTVATLKSMGDISAKGAKKFVIDHPTDNTKLIQHAAIESNNVYNMYFGTVTTNSNGFANCILPDYFKDINNYGAQINYQLTVQNSSGNFVQAIVLYEYDYDTNYFTIKTSSPNTTVHWQLTAKRNDNYMQGNPFYDVINK